jgi:hypothetical protein
MQKFDAKIWCKIWPVRRWEQLLVPQNLQGRQRGRSELWFDQQYTAIEFSLPERDKYNNVVWINVPNYPPISPVWHFRGPLSSIFHPLAFPG